jgi:hypothetical protein
MRDMLKSMSLSSAQSVVFYSLFYSLASAVSYPVTLLKCTNFIDSAWSLSLIRAEMAGVELAKALLSREGDQRAVTLVGFSFGSGVIYSCLRELAKIRYGKKKSMLYTSLFGSSTSTSAAASSSAATASEKKRNAGLDQEAKKDERDPRDPTIGAIRSDRHPRPPEYDLDMFEGLEEEMKGIELLTPEQIRQNMAKENSAIKVMLPSADASYEEGQAIKTNFSEHQFLAKSESTDGGHGGAEGVSPPPQQQMLMQGDGDEDGDDDDELWEDVEGEDLAEKVKAGRELTEEEKEIAERNMRIDGLIQDVVILGCPFPIKNKSWERIRRLVNGRVINGYSAEDLLLSLTSRTSSITLAAGLKPAAVTGVESYDLGDIIKWHSDYCSNIKVILDRIDLTKPGGSSEVSGIVSL